MRHLKKDLADDHPYPGGCAGVDKEGLEGFETIRAGGFLLGGFAVVSVLS
jgi:hypothetical protein